MKVYFKEEQRFSHWFLWLILIGIGLIPIYGIYKQLIKGELFGDKPMSDAGLIFYALFTFAIIALISMIKLKTEIDEKGIRMKFFPFSKQNVAWNEISEAKIVNYGFVGGWGIRIWTKYGTVYNIKGRTGLALELKNGKKFLIGTQKGFELEQLIKKIQAASSDNH